MLIPSPLMWDFVKTDLPNSWGIVMVATLVFMVVGFVAANSVMNAVDKAESPPPEELGLSCC